MYLGVLKVKDENRYQDPDHWTEARISGSASIPKCHGSTTLTGTYLKQDLQSGDVLGQGGELIAPRLGRPEFLLTVVSRRLRE